MFAMAHLSVTDRAQLLLLPEAINDYVGPDALLPASSSSAHFSCDRRLRIADTTSVSGPGSAGTDFRLHAAYDPSRSRFTYLDVSDAHGGETFTRLPLAESDIFIGDRAYARAVFGKGACRRR
jgi:hypothetical protein